MLQSSQILADPLLLNAAPCTACRNTKAPTALSLLMGLGCAVLLNRRPCMIGSCRRQPDPINIILRRRVLVRHKPHVIDPGRGSFVWTMPGSPVLCNAEPGPPTAATVMTFGKHRGRTFADVKDNEPAYVSWALQQEAPSPGLEAFIAYLREEGVNGGMSVPSQGGQTFAGLPLAQQVATANALISFGKHRGKTFAHVKANEPAYVAWALRQTDPTGGLQAFIAYLKAEGPEASQNNVSSQTVRQAISTPRLPQAQQQFNEARVDPLRQEAIGVHKDDLGNDQTSTKRRKDDQGEHQDDFANLTSATLQVHKGDVNARWIDQLGHGWAKALHAELTSNYFLTCLERVQDAREKANVYPHAANVFKAFELCPLERVRVVIVGQDPYHQPGQAMGLSFAVPRGIKLPPSLNNIYKMAGIDCGHGDLSNWAKQGVFLLNSYLTVEEGKPLSHKEYGWDIFTSKVIDVINHELQGVIFLLWGKPAEKKAANVDQSRHAVFIASHPSPLSARRGFFDCQHFAKANEVLRHQGHPEISWHPDKLPLNEVVDKH